MAWRPHSHYKVNPRNPRALGCCDRCGDIYNLETDLYWQQEWRGNILLNIWLRVCKKCLDVPQDQLRPKALPPDPVAVFMPRTFNYAAADAGGGNPSGPITPPNYLITEGGDLISDNNNNLIVSEN